MRLRRKLQLMRPLTGALLFAGGLLGIRLLLNWTISEMNPRLPFWSALSQVLGPVIGTTIASAAVYVLLRSLHRQRELLASLNHEVRNALQIFAYLIPISDVRYQAAARDALERLKKAVGSISERLVE